MADAPPVPFEMALIPMLDDITGFVAVIYQEPDVHPDGIAGHGMWYQKETGRPGYLSFKIIEQIGADGDTAYYSGPGPVPVVDALEAKVIADGSVKWDGCMNWTTGGEVMVHQCSLGQLDLFHQAVRAAVALIYETIVAEDMRG